MCNEAKVGRMINKKDKDKDKNKRNWRADLISVLIENKNHFSLASDIMKCGIDNFCEILNTQKIVHASPNKSGMVWQSRPLLSCFCEIFDPIMRGIFTDRSKSYCLLDIPQSFLPLAETLTKKEECRNIAEKIKESILSLENMLPIDVIDANKHTHPNNWDGHIEAAESLELLASCLYAIHDEFSSKVTRWCKVCFRKSSSSSIYCDLHRPSKNNALQDTQHRKGLRISGMIPSDIKDKWDLHQAKRSAIGDNYILLSSSKDVPNHVSPDTSGIGVPKQLKEFVNATQSESWSQVCDEWNVLLKNLPNVKNTLKKQANEFNSWSDFRSKILISLKNEHETTQDPYWIFLMLISAEKWLEMEKEFSDTRLTETESKIINLASLGKGNIEIAKELNVSRSYVCQIVKRNNIP